MRIILLKVHQDPPHHHPQPNKRLWMQCTGGGDIANPNFLSHQYNLRTSFVNFYVCHPHHPHHRPHHRHAHPLHPHPHHHPPSILIILITIITIIAVPLLLDLSGSWGSRLLSPWSSPSWGDLIDEQDLDDRDHRNITYIVWKEEKLKTWGTPQWPKYLSKSYITMITK